jgi:IS5 family transposase
LLHGEETLAYGDAGYQGIDKRADADRAVSWQIAMRPGERKALNKDNPADALLHKSTVELIHRAKR